MLAAPHRHDRRAWRHAPRRREGPRMRHRGGWQRARDAWYPSVRRASGRL